MQLTSKDIAREENDVHVVAGKLPTSWKDAVASYLEERKRSLASALPDVKDFEAKTSVFHIHALTAIAAYIGGHVKNPPKVQITAPTRDKGQHYITLANLLCPSGWDKTIRPVLEALANAAIREIGECEPVTMPCAAAGKDEKVAPEIKRYREQVGTGQPIGLHQAIAKETRRLIRFLHSVEDRGGDAAAQIERESRGIGAPQRRPGTLVRAVG